MVEVDKLKNDYNYSEKTNACFEGLKKIEAIIDDAKVKGLNLDYSRILKALKTLRFNL